MAYLQSQLAGCCFCPMEGALCAYFDYGKSHTVAFRADCDGLPIGHCCGHDGHMAILLEFARRLKQLETLPQNVLLIFQPGEETTGGAEDLCATGILETYRVVAVFGLHIWPGLPTGAVFTRPGPMMAAACQIDGRVTGIAGHIAGEGPDAVAAAAEFIAKTYWDGPEGLMKYGLVQGGTAGNIRAQQVLFQGSLRCFEHPLLQQQKRFLQRTATKLGKLYGCHFSLQIASGYPPVCNHSALVQQAVMAAKVGLLGKPVWMSEDFSFYQQRVPGAFFFLGAGDGPALHTPEFEFPRQILLQGVALWEKLAGCVWA